MNLTEEALAYMKLEGGAPILGTKIDVAFIGSCTNGRLSDFREVAKFIKGKKVAAGVKAIAVPGSQIDTEGRVSFEDAPGERGTRVTLIIAYQPPGGALGKGLAKLFGREPAIQARHDLKRFKMLMETGEIATSAPRREEDPEVQEAKQRQLEKV